MSVYVCMCVCISRVEFGSLFLSEEKGRKRVIFNMEEFELFLLRDKMLRLLPFSLSQKKKQKTISPTSQPLIVTLVVW